MLVYYGLAFTDLPDSQLPEGIHGSPLVKPAAVPAIDRLDFEILNGRKRI